MLSSKCLFWCQILVLGFIMLDARPQNVNISQSGDIRIVTTNGQLNCDSMICPENSSKCKVEKKTTPDLESIQRTRTCLDASGKTTKHEQVTEKNPLPGTSINDYSEAEKTGSNVFQCNGCGEEAINRANEFGQQFDKNFNLDFGDAFKNFPKF